MSLEGDGKPPEEEGSGNKIDAKVRQYNYSYVREVLRGEIEEFRVAWSIIKSLKKADRWTDTDHVSEILDKNSVKLWC